MLATETVAPFCVAVTVSAVEVPASSVTASAPVSSCWPLKRVRLAMLSSSERSASISSPIAWRSLLERVVFPDWIASSRTRWRMPCTSPRAPSAVWSMEMPSWAFRWPCRMPRTWARIFSEMARPAASSAARFTRRPLDSFSNSPPSWRLVDDRFRCALSAATFVLICKDMLVSSTDAVARRPCRAFHTAIFEEAGVRPIRERH